MIFQVLSLRANMRETVGAHVLISVEAIASISLPKTTLFYWIFAQTALITKPGICPMTGMLI